MSITFPLDARMYWLIDGDWVDVTGDARYAGAFAIDRGRADERSTVSASKLRAQVSNFDGRYSLRHPSSPYYGLLGRAVPVRVDVEGQPSYLRLYGGGQVTTGGYVTASDHASLDIVGDIDIRVDIDPVTWRPPGEVVIVGKYLTSGDQRSWLFTLNPNGTLSLYWTTAGTLATRRTLTSTAAVNSGSGRRVLRVTLDVNNGSGGVTANFFTGTAVGGAVWTAIGTGATSGTTSSIFNSTAPINIGAMGSNEYLTGGSRFNGRVHAVQVRNGIAGTVVANPDFTITDIGETFIVDSAGRSWVLVNDATVISDGQRFYGELPNLALKWDKHGADVRAEVNAQGILSRIGQGDKTVQSPIYRTMLASPGLVAYLPMEDGSGATLPGSAAPNGPPAVGSNLSFAPDDTLPASNGVMVFNDGTSSFSVPVQPYTATANISLTFLFKLAQLPTVPLGLIYFSATGSLGAVSLAINSGSFGLTVYGSPGEVVDTWTPGFGTIDVTDWVAMHIGLQQEGTSVRWTMVYTNVGTGAVFGNNVLLPNEQLGRLRLIGSYATAEKAGARMAHVIGTSAPFAFVDTDFLNPIGGHIGESVNERLVRLAGENGITLRVIRGPGGADETPQMGPQRPGKLLDLMQIGVETDGGILYESRHFAGLEYRTRGSLENQGRAHEGLSLPYTSLTGIEPTDDVQGVWNDVTLTNEAGSSTRVVQESGPLNVNDPATDPQGIGRYELPPTTVSLADDADLFAAAQRKLVLGTWDESRYPSLQVMMNSGQVDADTADRLLRLDVGDRFTLTGLPEWLPPDDVAQLAQGFSEVIGRHTWPIDINASPAGPYEVGVWDDTDGTAIDATRFDTDSSTLAATITTGVAASMSVATAAGASLWVTDPSQFPIDINVGGARIRVTAVAGATSPQTFTISTTVVNGVSKIATAGTQVRLWRPARYGL